MLLPEISVLYISSTVNLLGQHGLMKMPIDHDNDRDKIILSKEDWRRISKELRPDWTDEDFEANWEDFLYNKAGWFVYDHLKKY